MKLFCFHNKLSGYLSMVWGEFNTYCTFIVSITTEGRNKKILLYVKVFRQDTKQFSVPEFSRNPHKGVNRKNLNDHKIATVLV